MNKESLILITGHTGLLGSAIVRELQRQGFNNLIVCTHNEVDYICQKATEELFADVRPDYVFHCAAKVGGIFATSKYQADFLYENLMIMANVIEASHRHKVKRLLIPGSVCAFPKDCPVPIKEEYAMTGAFEPTCEGYAMAKMAGQMLIKYYNEQYATDFLMVNLCNLYGENDCWDISRNHVIPALIERFHFAEEKQADSVTLFGTGQARREFMHADDAAAGCIALMGNNFVSAHTYGSTINFGSNEVVSIRDLANIIKDIVGYEGSVCFDGDISKDGAAERTLDSSRLNRLLRKDLIPLIYGIDKVYRSYVETCCSPDLPEGE